VERRNITLLIANGWFRLIVLGYGGAAVESYTKYLMEAFK
jgi:hypothetical protein